MRTKGLIEISEFQGTWEMELECVARCRDILMGHKQVNLAHRTVGEFLRAKEMHQSLLSKAELPSTITNLVLRSSTATVQSVCSIAKFCAAQSSEELVEEFLGHIRLRIILRNLMVNYCNCAREDIRNGRDPPHWDDLTRAMCRPLGAPFIMGLHVAELSDMPLEHPELLFSVCTGVRPQSQLALKRILSSNKHFDGTVYLSYAVRTCQHRIACLFMENGVNPNGPARSTTPWKQFLSYLCCYRRPLMDRRRENLDLAVSFLKHGACLKATCECVVYSESSPGSMRYSFVENTSKAVLCKVSFTAVDIMHHLFRGTDIDIGNLIPPTQDDQPHLWQLLVDVAKDHFPDELQKQCPKCNVVGLPGLCLVCNA